ncbi:hypothetical protein PG985_000799 [Apiospora marii]|uniref:uncharacterized protein n=1 Tax=Apiospora marii TaxID=335849 RepID=UPI003131DF07
MHQSSTTQDTTPAAEVGGETRRLTTGDGTNYVYSYSPAANASRPTFLLLHGYPSSRHGWRHQLSALAQLGYGVLAPDMLGMGDSDKPTGLEAYRSKRISGHLKELLEHESLRQVIGVGPASSSTWTRSTARPWLESFFHLLYHADAAQWGQNFAMVGAARAWLHAGSIQPLPMWLTEEDKTLWLRLYSQPDAAESSLSYYRAVMRGIFEEDEAVLSDEDRKLKVPIVGIGGAKDQVSIPEDMTAVTKPYTTKGYTEHVLDAGHWVMLEQKEKVTSILAEFAASLTADH